MFYLVQHPDLDIRYYSWNILTLSACIFIAVLASDVVNQCAKRFLFSGIKVGGWGPVLLDVALAVMWFLASQLVTAALSGAFGEEAKEPKERRNALTAGRIREAIEGQPSFPGGSWKLNHLKGAELVADGVTKPLMGQSFEDFQQDLGMKSGPQVKSMFVVPAALLLVTLLYRLAAFTRKKISEMDDGVVSRGEALWDEISEEAENESLCLGLSFAAIRSISFFAIGAMPDTHFHIYSDVSNANWHRGWMVLAGVSVGCMVMGIITLKIKERGSRLPAVPKEDDIRLRGLLILSETALRSFSWGMLSCSISMLNAFLPHLEHHLIGHLIVALVVSALSCVMLVSLDKVADYLKASGDADSAVHIIQHIILAHGLLIGISWEVCFAIGMHAIGHAMEGPNVDVYLALFLCLVVVPAYRLFMLPELKQREAKVKKYCMSASLAVGLSFPVATMAKSAKMVPVMIGSLVLGSARFSSAELGQAAAIVGASRTEARCKTEKKKVHHYDLMFWTNLYMAGASLLFALARSEMREGSRFCLQNPRLAGKILKFATCGALGQACVFYTIAHFDRDSP
eukprot:g245.t1